MSAKPEGAPQPKPDADPKASREAAMEEVVAVSINKWNTIKGRKSTEEVAKYLHNPSELLAEIRQATKLDMKVALERAFDAFDTKPADGKLSREESRDFIQAYCKAVQRFIEQVYIDGFEALNDGGKKVDREDAKRVARLFEKESADLQRIWHEACDRNRDGLLQINEVKQAFLDRDAGEAEKRIGEFMEKEFQEILFNE